jgi:superfamily I DNA/RNA helicase
VLLFEAGTDAGTYEDALRRRGLPTVRATGRGYYGQQEVGDLLAYLRLLINRTDDARCWRPGLAAGRRSRTTAWR